MALNKVILTGNLTRDPEVSTTTSGLRVAKFSIAVNRKYKNDKGNYDTDFLNIVAWKSLADLCGQYLHKGSKVGIVGSIQTRTYEKDGVTRHATDIIADEVEFLTTPIENNTQPKTFKGTSNEPVSDDEMPF